MTTLNFHLFFHNPDDKISINLTRTDQLTDSETDNPLKAETNKRLRPTRRKTRKAEKDVHLHLQLRVEVHPHHLHLQTIEEEGQQKWPKLLKSNMTLTSSYPKI